jgi:hypothetical protein
MSIKFFYFHGNFHGFPDSKEYFAEKTFFEFDCADPRAADTKPTPHSPALWTTCGSRLADVRKHRRWRLTSSEHMSLFSN